VRMRSIGAFLRKPGNQRLLSWLGGGAVIVAGGIWTVVTYVWPPHSPESGANKGVVIGGSVSHSKITNTINQENPATLVALVDAATKQGMLADQLKVTVDAVEGMLRTVGEENTPAEQIPVRLSQFAARYVALRQQIGQISDANPAGSAVKARAAVYPAPRNCGPARGSRSGRSSCSMPASRTRRSQR